MSNQELKWKLSKSKMVGAKKSERASPSKGLNAIAESLALML